MARSDVDYPYDIDVDSTSWPAFERHKTGTPMKAWLLDKLDGVENLRLGEVPEPVPGNGEALIALTLAGLNPADRYLAKGEYPAKPMMPHILGRDGLGTIEKIGSGVIGFRPGDRVIVLRSEVGVNRPGTFAQKVVVPVESLASVPSGWTEEQAAGAALVYLTAHQALSQWGELPPCVVLVTGASGGVGVASVQLASAAGYTVIGLSRSEKKRIELLKIGAEFCFDPGDENWPSQLKQSLGTHRVDLAIDNIGGPEFSRVIGVLGHNGKVSVVGRLAGPVPEFNTSTLFFRRIKIGGVHVGDFKPPEAQAAWKSVVETMNRAGAKPLVDSVFPFEKLIDAFGKLERGPMGKVLVAISQ
jgi:NADPH2:quinone reductase